MQDNQKKFELLYYKALKKYVSNELTFGKKKVY